MSKGKKSIVKDSERIKELLKLRFEELGLSNTKIVEDANERGMQFTNAMLSRYMKKGNVAGGLTEENIIWLCFRYGIEIKLVVGSLRVNKENKIEIVVPPYNEEKCLSIINKLFNVKEKIV